MSASVDSKNKGQSNQVHNGPPTKDSMKESEFDYLQGQPQHQGGYGSVPMSSPSVTDPYMSSYYASMPFSGYLNQGGMNDAAWSNGDPMSFLGGYGQISNDYMSTNGMFSGFGGYNQPGFEWGIPGGDYSAWGNGSAQGRKNDDRQMYDNYYSMGHMDYSGMNGEVERDQEGGVKGVEQGLKGMSLQDKQHESSGKENGHHSGHGGHHGHGHGHGGGSGGGSGAPPSGGAKTWASVAKQPARPQPQLRPKTIPRAPMMPGKQNMDIGTWDNSRGGGSKQGSQRSQGAWGSSGSRGGSGGGRSGFQPYNNSGPSNSSSNGGRSNSPAAASKGSDRDIDVSHPVLEKLQSANQYNPKNFTLNLKGARYFIIKSYSEDDIHRSIKYSIWCSTEHGNKRLDASFREREGKGPVYLLYSVNGSGHFCGMAQMMSPVDYNSNASVWAQDKWKGRFEVKWIYVKDVPNSQLRHIRLENNENKPVTNSRDTQEVPPEKGKQVVKIIHNYNHTTSIFDDFSHYEKRQEEEEVKPATRPPPARSGRGGGRGNRDSGRDDRRDRD